MPVAAAVIMRMAEMGLSGKDIGELCALIEASAPSPDHAPSAIEKRRAYDRERKRRAKEGNSTGIPPEHSTGIPQESSDQFHRNSTGIPPENPPLARVVDITSSTENTGLADAVVDDWPVGDLVTRLSSEIASPRLDPSKAVGLITTSGRLAAWKREGASWHHDVIPVVRGLCSKRGPPISSWKYFDDAIAQSIASNREALKIPAHERPRQDSYTPSATDPRRANTVSRRSAWARIAEERGDLGPGTDEGPDSGGLGRHDGPREGGERLAGPSLNATGRDRA